MAPPSLKMMRGSKGRQEGIYASADLSTRARSPQYGLGLTLLPGSQIQKEDEHGHRAAPRRSRAIDAAQRWMEKRRMFVGEQQAVPLGLRETLSFESGLLHQIGKSRVNYGTKAQGWRRTNQDNRAPSPQQGAKTQGMQGKIENLLSDHQRPKTVPKHSTSRGQRDDSSSSRKRRKLLRPEEENANGSRTAEDRRKGAEGQTQHHGYIARTMERIVAGDEHEEKETVQKATPNNTDGTRVCSDVTQEGFVDDGLSSKSIGLGLDNAGGPRGFLSVKDYTNASEKDATQPFFKREYAHRDPSNASLQREPPEKLHAPYCSSSEHSKRASGLPLQYFSEASNKQLRSLTTYYPYVYSTPVAASYSTNTSRACPASRPLPVSATLATLSAFSKATELQDTWSCFEHVNIVTVSGVKQTFRRHQRTQSSPIPSFGRLPMRMASSELGSGLGAQEQTHPNVEDDFTCGQCGNAFKSEYRLNQHILKAHDKDLRQSCQHCDSRFWSSTRFEKHVKTCTAAGEGTEMPNREEEKHQCPFCHLQYPRLSLHVRRSHGNETVRCGGCGQLLSCANAFYQHDGTCQGIMQPEAFQALEHVGLPPDVPILNPSRLPMLPFKLAYMDCLARAQAPAVQQRPREPAPLRALSGQQDGASPPVVGELWLAGERPLEVPENELEKTMTLIKNLRTKNMELQKENSAFKAEIWAEALRREEFEGQLQRYHSSLSDEHTRLIEMYDELSGFHNRLIESHEKLADEHVNCGNRSSRIIAETIALRESSMIAFPEFNQPLPSVRPLTDGNGPISASPTPNQALVPFPGATVTTPIDLSDLVDVPDRQPSGHENNDLNSGEQALQGMDFAYPFSDPNWDGDFDLDFNFDQMGDMFSNTELHIPHATLEEQPEGPFTSSNVDLPTSGPDAAPLASFDVPASASPLTNMDSSNIELNTSDSGTLIPAQHSATSADKDDFDNEADLAFQQFELEQAAATATGKVIEPAEAEIQGEDERMEATGDGGSEPMDLDAEGLEQSEEL